MMSKRIMLMVLSIAITYVSFAQEDSIYKNWNHKKNIFLKKLILETQKWFYRKNLLHRPP